MLMTHGRNPATTAREAAPFDMSEASPSRSMYDVCKELEKKIDDFLAAEVPTQLLSQVQKQTRIAVEVVNEALKKYSLDDISLSYNGGKDCLVLLILILACIPRAYSKATSEAPEPPSTSLQTEESRAAPTPSTPPSPFPASLQAVYIVSPHPFPEIDDFVDASVTEYHLDLRRYTLPMRAGLDQYLSENAKARLDQTATTSLNGAEEAHLVIGTEMQQKAGGIRAIFVGTRRTDPHGEQLTHFDRTDHGWPDFMRIHPVIDWKLAEIWAFLRHLEIPYLSLYDQGFTSLGGMLDTRPNPRLKMGEGENGRFRPAYELLDDCDERLGRDR